jgi:hypothetical protein
VNDVPVAVNDTAVGVGGLGTTVNLLANDTDVDGAADLSGVVITGAPAGLVYTLAGGLLTFTAPAATYAFTYQARDAATATVTLSGGETLQLIRADYIVNKRRWRIDGTSTVLGAQTVYVMYADGIFANGAPAAGFLVATSQMDPITGLFLIDFALAGTNDPRNPAGPQFSVPPTLVYAITSLGGSSPTRNILVK